MSVDNSAAHPKTGHLLDPTPIAAERNPEEQVAAGDQARVRTSLTHVANQQPQGFQGLLEQFRNNGLTTQAEAWRQGNAEGISVEDVQQGLGEDLLLTIANGAGVSQEVARELLADVLPQVMVQHAG